MDITTAMTPPPSEQQSEYAQKDMSGHSEMMCQVLMQLGRIDAKIDMMMAEDKKEDESEKESEGESEGIKLPDLYSAQLEFSMPGLD